MKRDDKHHLISKLKFFPWLDNSLQKSLLIRGRVKDFKKNQNLSLDFRLDEYLLIILQGAAVLSKSTQNDCGAKIFLTKDYLYSAVDLELSRTTFVKTDSGFYELENWDESRLLFTEILGKCNGLALLIPIDILKKMISNNEKISFFLSFKNKILLENIYRQQIISTAIRPSDRVIKQLLFWGEKFCPKAENGDRVLPKWITVHDLAVSASTTDRTVRRIFSELASRNLVIRVGYKEKRLKEQLFIEYKDFN
ncbi:hypothetical protein [Liquorilactobacillus sicerae]|uniref:hypothetical protein n=1 Tax=Liquorilactobacillus sicerae TaxID=1416943 RepID=UPI00248017A0|nr:hypothetical protein [Liquorilactobacillus sicerae]